MAALDEFMHNWEKYLNQDAVLNKRNEHIQSTIKEGKDVVELDIKERGVLTVELKEKGFQLKKDKAEKPLLSWSVPATLFKEVLLGKERIIYALLDKECTLSFDSPHFTHWNGTTALAVILAAQEMVKKDPGMKKMVEDL